MAVRGRIQRRAGLAAFNHARKYREFQLWNRCTAPAGAAHGNMAEAGGFEPSPAGVAADNRLEVGSCTTEARLRKKRYCFRPLWPDPALLREAGSGLCVRPLNAGRFATNL